LVLGRGFATRPDGHLARMASRDVSSKVSRIQVVALFPPTRQADVNMTRSEKSQQNFPFNPTAMSGCQLK